jgi:(2Fe-2S) ferredoxin
MTDARLDVSHPEGGPRCSTGSAMRGESMVATASAGRHWLLVEIASGWGWNAFTGSRAIDPELGRALARKAQDAGWRILAIRRPGRARRAVRWRWALVDTAPGSESVRWGEAATPDELLDAPFVPGAGTPSEDPIFAVCAHGRHDECCAVRGRRVAADLAERYPDLTWECSHMGGDRFAATMLLFPHGLNYGRVDHADAPYIADEYLAGRIVPAHFRGRSALPRPEQAAQHAAMLATNERGIDAHPLIDAVRTSEGWRVRVGGPRGELAVELVERLGEPLYTMCTATLPVQVRHFEATVRP